jgi:MerR family transcriptional regulator, thiopeptide resistance regulator
MWTVTKLARSCGLSRTTVLYYESIGLLDAAARTQGNYRRYGDKDVSRLRQIRAYRDAGLTLADIRTLLNEPEAGAGAVLRRRMLEIGSEIETLRAHQRAIARLLHVQSDLERTEMVTKDRWVSIMRKSGFTDDDMHKWHAEFEKSAPGEHQEFLEFLHIPDEEIRSIRKWSRDQANHTSDSRRTLE